MEKATVNLESFDQIKKNNSLQSNEIEKVKNKDILIIMGNTNSGKSTFTNYQIGHKLEEAEDDYENENECWDTKLKLKKNSKVKDFVVIGNHIESTSIGIKTIQDNEINMIYVDTQGLMDNRSPDLNISYNFVLEELLKNVNSVKFGITMALDELTSTKGRDGDKVLDFIKNLFSGIDNIEEHKNSILILITKQNTTKLTKLKNDFLKSDNKLKKILANRIIIYDPLEKNKKCMSRNQIIKNLKEMNSIKKKFFEFPYTLEDISYISELLISIDKEIKAILEKEK